VFVFVFKTVNLERFRQTFEPPRGFNLAYTAVFDNRAKATFSTTWQLSYAKIPDVKTKQKKKKNKKQKTKSQSFVDVDLLS
jgi:hypothetical protein